MDEPRMGMESIVFLRGLGLLPLKRVQPNAGAQPLPEAAA